MIKFTNLRTKALALVAMTAFSVGSVFGQNADLPLNTTPKIIQWDGVNKQTAPLSNGILVQGIYMSFTNDNWTSKFPVTSLATAPTGNPSNSTYWVDSNGLNVFAGEGNQMAVTFDISAKYLKNVKNLEIVLGRNLLGGANMTASFDATIEVFDASTLAPIPYADIYTLGTDALGLKTGVYNTNKEDDVVLNLFQIATDLTEDHKFMEGSIDNSLIRVTLTSNLPTGAPDNHFPAALVVKEVKMYSDAPSITLTPSKKSFKAGMGYTTLFAESSVAVSSTLADGANIALTAPTGFVFTGDVAAKTVALPLSPAEPFAFMPTKINLFSGSFDADFSVGSDPLNPIKNIPVITTAVDGNSVPVLNLSEDKLTFEANMITPKAVQIWGENIPNPSLYRKPEYEGAWFTIDQDLSSFSTTAVRNDFSVTGLGVIEKIASNKLVINYAEMVNNIDFNPTVYVKINRGYLVPNALTGGAPFTGGKEVASIGLAKYPQVLVVGDVAAVWFEYEGQDSKAGDIVGDISTAFYAPYDASLENQAYSRVKKFILKGTKVEPDAGKDFATFKISLEKLATHDDEGHMAFFYSVDKGLTWNTPVTTKEITVPMLTTADAENFKNVGFEIWVKFRPDCDGFVANFAPSVADFNGYEWDPHYNLLKAVQKNRLIVNTKAKVFGDTRANLENTIHEWKLVDVMDNSFPSSWDSWVLTKSTFRKNYGTKYLNECGEQVNPLSEGSFLVSGYNLTSNVTIDINHSGKYNNDAFAYDVEILEGYGRLDSTDSNIIIPNEFGEVYAKVSVKFDPATRDSIFSNVQDFVTVEYDGRTIEDGKRWWDSSSDAEFDYVDWLTGDEEEVRFVYPMYKYPSASLTGRIFVPTVNDVDVENVQTPINVAAPQTILISGKELDPTKKSIIVSLAEAGTPYTITPSKFDIDADGNVSDSLTITFNPTTTADLCKNTNSLVYAYGSCPELPIEGSEIVAVTEVGQPTFGEMVAGDIQGNHVDVRVTPAVGAPNYTLGIGILEYKEKTSSIFMSEVNATNDAIYVELFNGTGENLNQAILDGASPNYFLELYENGTKVGTPQVLGTSESALWKPYGIVVKAINYNFASGKNYKLVLRQGLITQDVYEFTGNVSHMSRKDNLDLSAYKTTTFNEADWTTAGGWHTSLNDDSKVALYASMFHAEVPQARFKEEFVSEVAEKEVYSPEKVLKGLSINGLMRNISYTAFAKSEPACSAIKVVGHPATLPVYTSDSDNVSGDPMSKITFGFFTGIDQVEVAKNIYAANGKIYVAGATEGVTIFNALGMQVKAASIEEAAAGIDVANGIYMVKSGNKTAKVLVNR
ncbi:MAG: hypothetical protein PHH72_07625 [Parabacteroides sp.]|nr:hypothetical protein [Parabacteroides sp.]MDD3358873.1 hypothetical protein [Parabacteroides sp.]MDD4404559.1 hypothetical protein [Parabacteroides sp.]